MESQIKVRDLTDAEIKELVFKMTAETPNDMDLGGKIRAMYQRHESYIEDNGIQEFDK